MTTTQSFDSSKSPLETQSGLIGTALALLDQCLTLFSSSLTSDAQLSFESLLMPGATIGKHLRHILDHYRLLLDVLEADGRTVLNYDKRVRLTLIETSRTEAGEAVRSLQRRLRALDEKGGEWLGRKVTLDAVTPEEVRLESTAGRELWFVSLHAVHHLALLRIIAVGEVDLDLPSDFGVAPSTIESRKTATSSHPPPAQAVSTSPSKL